MMTAKKFFRQAMLFSVILMMVTSAALGYKIVIPNHIKISGLRADSRAKHTLYNDIWESSRRRDEYKNMAILLTLLDKNDDPQYAEARKHYLSAFYRLRKGGTIEQIIAESARMKEMSMDRIDKTFLEKISVDEQIDKLANDTKMYEDIIFLMQALSLVMIVLRKDFAVY